ncbi:hypothetical protein PSACC_00022 [Paramicrosporidium saccamoebae]|uniref:Prefoldin subunit 1 n=1 Tax=Paramicrosporidium saccamoebae TaxID=1246581 RepID=A0A2H9TR16_9FUNG|nr:hypothetical protein PSACC_00022 [Paramicrosporidium saccamoebae]
MIRHDLARVHRLGMSETLKKEFTAAQTRLGELVAEHRRVSEFASRKEHENKMSLLTMKELESLPAETAVYRTIGKAFILSDLPHVQERLRNVSSMALEEKEKMLTRKAQLEVLIPNIENKAKALYEELSAEQ